VTGDEYIERTEKTTEGGRIAETDAFDFDVDSFEEFVTVAQYPVTQANLFFQDSLPREDFGCVFIQAQF
jgi:hypothetical protein